MTSHDRPPQPEPAPEPKEISPEQSSQPLVESLTEPLVEPPVRLPAEPRSPNDPRIQFDIKDVYRTLDEGDDPYTQKLAEKAFRIKATRVRNGRLLADAREAVQAGEVPDISWDSLIPYPTPEWLQEDYRSYTVAMAGRGNLITRALAAHAHMPRKPDVQAVVLTPGDLRAAAEWGAMPQFDPTQTMASVKPHQRLRLLELMDVVDDAQFRKLSSDMRFAKMQRVRDVFYQTRECHTQGELRECLTQLVQKEFNPQELKSFLEESNVIAERLALTMIHRLGSRLQPELDVFPSRISTDIYSNVDLIVRYLHQEKIELIGIDVTTIQQHQAVDRKREHHRIKNRAGEKLRDPVTEEYQPALFQVLQLSGLHYKYVLNKWRQRRGVTTATPEFGGLRFSDRHDLVRAIHHCLKEKYSKSLYSDEDMIKAYRSLYSQHDPDQFQFSL